MANKTIHIHTPIHFAHYIENEITPTLFVEIAILVITACTWLCFELGTSGQIRRIYRVKCFMIILGRVIEIIFVTGVLPLTDAWYVNYILNELASFSLLCIQSTSVSFLYVARKCTLMRKVHVEKSRFSMIPSKMLACFLALAMIKALESCVVFLPDESGVVGEICGQVHPLELTACCVMTVLCIFYGSAIIRVVVKSISFAEEQGNQRTIKPRICLCVMVFFISANQMTVFALTITVKVLSGFHTGDVLRCIDGSPSMEEILQCDESIISEMTGHAFINAAWPPVLDVVNVAALAFYKKYSA